MQGFGERVGPVELGTVVGVIFTANRPITLGFFSLSNRTAADRFVTLHLVPRGSTPSNSNKFADTMRVMANDYFPREVTIPMTAGDTLQGFGDAAGIIFLGAYTDEKKKL